LPFNKNADLVKKVCKCTKDLNTTKRKKFFFVKNLKPG